MCGIYTAAAAPLMMLVGCASWVQGWLQCWALELLGGMQTTQPSLHRSRAVVYAWEVVACGWLPDCTSLSRVHTVASLVMGAPIILNATSELGATWWDQIHHRLSVCE
jgi:hypothetical protein